MRWLPVLSLVLVACTPPNTTQLKVAFNPTATRLSVFLAPLGEDPALERQALEVSLCVASEIGRAWPDHRESQLRTLIDVYLETVEAWRNEPQPGTNATAEEFFDRLRGYPLPGEELGAELDALNPFVLDCEERVGTNVEFL